jgi:hypothetical protein
MMNCEWGIGNWDPDAVISDLHGERDALPGRDGSRGRDAALTAQTPMQGAPDERRVLARQDEALVCPL